MNASCDPSGNPVILPELIGTVTCVECLCLSRRLGKSERRSSGARVNPPPGGRRGARRCGIRQADDVAPARLAADRKASRIFGRRLRAAASAGATLPSFRVGRAFGGISRGGDGGPHMAGSAGSEAVATYLHQALAEAGFEVEVLEYRAYLSVPGPLRSASPRQSRKR